MILHKHETNGTILIVEDNDDDYEFTLRSIKKSDIKNPITRCTEGQEALDYLYSFGKYAGEHTPKPSIIILDLSMPGLDGREVLKKIKNDQNLKKIPVVILTTSGDSYDIQSCYDLGANTYIEKPANMDDFIDIFKSLKNYWLQVASLPTTLQ